jgi:NifB/MoaA-like Fe-S oxidoreductase
LDFPEDDEYFDYPQIENGVGISRKFLTEFEESILEIQSSGAKPAFKSCSLITGKLSADIMIKIASRLKDTFDINMKVMSVRNNFLGDSITVTGLLTGKDIIDFIKKKDVQEPILIPDVIFSDACGLTLDNMTQDIVRSDTGMDIIYVSEASAQKLISSLFLR